MAKFCPENVSQSQFAASGSCGVVANVLVRVKLHRSSQLRRGAQSAGFRSHLHLRRVARRPKLDCKSRVQDPYEDPDPEAWRRAPAAFRLPRLLETPGRWFALAGLLKIIIVTAPWSPYLLSLVKRGCALPLNLLSWALIAGASAGLVYIAKYIVENDLIKRTKWLAPLLLMMSGVVIVLCSAAVSRHNVLHPESALKVWSPRTYTQQQLGPPKESVDPRIARKPGFGRPRNPTPPPNS